MVVNGFRLIFQRPLRLVREPGSTKRGIARGWSWSLPEASTWTQKLPTDTGDVINLSVSYRCYRVGGRQLLAWDEAALKTEGGIALFSSANLHVSTCMF